MKRTNGFWTMGAGVLLAVLLAAVPASAKDDVETFDMDETYSVGDGGTIYLYSDDADVRITGSDREDVRVVIHYRHEIKGFFSSVRREGEFTVEVIEDEGNLRIRELEPDRSYSGFMTTSFEEHTVEIECPRNVSLRLHGDDDDYIIRGIDGDLRMDVDDASVDLTDYNGSRLEVSMDDGELIGAGVKGLLDISMDDGEAILDDCHITELMASMDDGSLELQTSLKDDGRYRMRCDDGSFMLDITSGGGEFECDFNHGRVRSSGEFELLDEDEGYRLLKLPGGTAQLRFVMDDGYISLRKR